MADFIVVGGGSSGAVVASRLSADPSIEILLLEAGADRPPMESLVPAAFSKLFAGSFDWHFRTAPEPNLADRTLYWPRGKMLGGSSAMNAMIWTRGARADFDRWASAGNAGWSYADLEPHFDAAELPETSGPSPGRVGVTMSRLRTVNPITTALVAAAHGHGIAPNDGFGGGEMDGAGLFRVSQYRGRRVSTATGYLEPIRTRPNLTIVAEATVERVLVEGRRAVGVRYRHAGGVDERRGRVILAAGAIGSPELLLRSGIGPATELEAIGVTPIHDLPGVGRNLQDHLSIGLMFHSRRPVSMASAERLDHLANYLIRRRGPLTSNVAEGGAFVRLEPGAVVPDIELIFAPTFFVDHGRGNPAGHGYTIAAILQHPSARGQIGLDRDHRVRIRPNYLAEAGDLARLVGGLELAAAIGERTELKEFRGARYLPAAGVDLATFVRERAETLYHPVGTCKMGSDAAAVVTDRLAVRGLEDLWVADASIMPTITTGHPNAAAVVIGERMARLATA